MTVLLSYFSKSLVRASGTILSRSRTMSSSIAPLLLTPGELKQLTGETSVSILDASWFMPNSPRKPHEEYLAERIPGARYLDLDEVASKHELGLKHMMPSERMFADACESLAIDKASHVVIYDSQGVFSSPRALFMFRTFGHEKSSVLNGGLARWKAEGYNVDKAAPQDVQKTQYSTPTFQNEVIKNYKQMVSNSGLDPSIDSAASIVLDARPKPRFLGTGPEPRPGLSSGHMPHSFSLAFNTFLQTQKGPDGTEYTVFKSPAEVQTALVAAVGAEEAEKIVAGKRSVITSCGSGMTAGILWLGLKLLGAEKISLYDESWTGYADPSRSSKIEKSTDSQS